MILNLIKKLFIRTNKNDAVKTLGRVYSIEDSPAAIFYKLYLPPSEYNIFISKAQERFEKMSSYLKINNISIHNDNGVTYFMRNDNRISEETLISWIKKEYPNF